MRRRTKVESVQVTIERLNQLIENVGLRDKAQQQRFVDLLYMPRDQWPTELYKFVEHRVGKFSWSGPVITSGIAEWIKQNPGK